MLPNFANVIATGNASFAGVNNDKDIACLLVLFDTRDTLHH
jgi:hypothetical protein